MIGKEVVNCRFHKDRERSGQSNVPDTSERYSDYLPDACEGVSDYLPVACAGVSDYFPDAFEEISDYLPSGEFQAPKN